MVAGPLDVISVDEMKEELRFLEPDFDAAIARQIAAAVDWVEAKTCLPILNRELSFDHPYPDRFDPSIVASFLTEIRAVKYWQPTDSLRGPPTGTISIGDLQRIESTPTGVFVAWSPADGWPAALPDTPIRWDVTVGLAEVPESLVQAVIMLTRHFFDGLGAIRKGHAVFHLVAAHRYWNDHSGGSLFDGSGKP